MRIAPIAVAALCLFAGCRGSAAWAETSAGYSARAENPYRAALRARVGADPSSSGPSNDDYARVEQEASVTAADVSASAGGLTLDLDFGGGAPAPSPWDAMGTPSTPSASAAIEQRLTAEVQRAPADERPRYAQNAAQPADDETPTATDAASRELLIYEAHLGLAVHHVSRIQDRVEAMARERGGFLHSRTDDTIVLRVPADAFASFVDALEELGEIVSRRVQVEDVTEAFHDVQQRIRTLEAMRARVEQLLAAAADVEDALAVQQHLERITVELEQLQGRLRVLSDRVAYSTITVHFAERSQASVPTFQLPFRWLHSLGLDTLLAL